MIPERWQRIEQLYHEALQHKAGERLAFVREICGDDVRLRQEVESLLEAHDRGGNFLSVAQEKPEALVGQQLGSYQILSLLGAGGMGVVYRARDTRLNRSVAIKVLPADKVSDPERKRRFIQEARAASALNHPNIITIHDIGSESGIDFIVMEYVAGKTLDRLIPRKGMRLNEALRLAVQTADALAKAHSAGIIHRDLKPTNVMLTDDGLVKVLDFGLAKLTELVTTEGTTRTRLSGTEEGMIVGTLSYMSPEQAEGKKVDTRSDVFSFGAVLYEMLTGTRAFQGSSPLATMTAILREDPKPASSVARGIPPELDRIIERCLRKDPERRFQSAADLKVALEDLRGEIRLKKPSVAAGSPARRWFWFAGLAVILTLAGLAAWVIRSPGPLAQMALRIRPLTSYPGSERNPSFSPDGTQVVFSWDGVSQDNTDIYVKLIASESQVRLTNPPSEDFSPVWSPDGRWIAFLRRESPERVLLLLIPPIGGREKQLGEIRSSSLGWAPRSLAWSPDSQWVVAPSGGFPGEPLGLHAFSLESGEKHRLTTSPKSPLGDLTPAFSPDGKTLVFARFTATGVVSELYLLSLSRDLTPTGEPVRLTFENRRTFAPTWSSDGSQIVFVSGRLHHPSLYRLSFPGVTRLTGILFVAASQQQVRCRRLLRISNL
jgi:serine/threonine protein kinase